MLSIVGAVYVVLVVIYSRPIQDDWWMIVDAQRWTFTHYMHAGLDDSGRFSQFALSWLSSRLFGSAAVNVVPLMLLTLAVSFTTATLRGIGKLLHRNPGRAEAIALAVLAVVGAVATAPSLYDTVGWFAAVVAYIAGLVTIMAAMACLISHANQRRNTLVTYVTVAVLAFVGGGFDEIVGAITAIAAALAVLTVRDMCGDASQYRLVGPLGAIALGAAAGTGLNVFSAGSQNRASLQGSHVSVIPAFHTALHNLTFLRADIHDGVLLLAVGAGIVAWQLFGSVEDRHIQCWLGIWALFLLAVPWLLTAALTAWAGSVESGDRSPFRVAFLATGSVALATVLIIVLALSLRPQLLSQARATLAALLLVALGLVGLSHKAAPTIRAELMRNQALAVRAVSIRRQLAEHRSIIAVTPAPLLTVDTQVYDLSFAPTSQQRPWLVGWFRTYYRIPDSARLDIAISQPRSYCLPSVAASWVGVRSCQELDRPLG